LTVAGKPVATPPPGVQIRGKTLLIPLRPVAERMLADLIIDPAAQTITLTRADDRQTIIYNAKNQTITFPGNPPQPEPSGGLVEMTPGQESLPVDLLQEMLNVFVATDPDKNQVDVV